MNQNVIEEYQEYARKIGNRKALYSVVAKEYSIKRAMYPGSHIDITPSLVIPEVLYIDHFKGAIRFYKDLQVIREYLEKNKEYSDPCKINFVGKDYTSPFEADQVDLIISQYAGFVGQATKRFLKTGGILLCNDSHGDATLARFDEDFEFIGVINGNHKIVSRDLENYFILPNGKTIDLKTVWERMKGLKYTCNAENYLFRKIK